MTTLANQINLTLSWLLTEGESGARVLSHVLDSTSGRGLVKVGRADGTTGRYSFVLANGIVTMGDDSLALATEYDVIGM